MRKNNFPRVLSAPELQYEQLSRKKTSSIQQSHRTYYLPPVNCQKKLLKNVCQESREATGIKAPFPPKQGQEAEALLLSQGPRRNGAGGGAAAGAPGGVRRRSNSAGVLLWERFSAKIVSWYNSRFSIRIANRKWLAPLSAHFTSYQERRRITSMNRW